MPRYQAVCSHSSLRHLWWLDINRSMGTNKWSTCKPSQMAWWEIRVMASNLRCNTTNNSHSQVLRIIISILLAWILPSRSCWVEATLQAKCNMFTHNLFNRDREEWEEYKFILKARPIMIKDSWQRQSSGKSEKESSLTIKEKEITINVRLSKSPGRDQWLPNISQLPKSKQQYVVSSTKSMLSKSDKQKDRGPNHHTTSYWDPQNGIPKSSG